MPSSRPAPRRPARRPRPLSVLLLVAHPDDDAIFAGELQRRAARHRFTVVVATHAAESARAAEVRAWQTRLGTDLRRIRFLGFPDDREDRRQARCSIADADVASRLRALRLRPSLLVTHNEIGEYHHPHHLLVHRVATQVYPDVPRLEFGHGLAHADLTLPCPPEKWSEVAAAYPSQASVIATFARSDESFVARPDGAVLRFVLDRLFD